ncbi:MAG: DUF5337 family protein [Albidovulum sp.]|nr:DUF5337 family protein [Albidovulum sp.]
MKRRRRESAAARSAAGSAAGSRDARKNARTRVGAIAVIATMILWMALSFGGGKLGLPIRYAFLLDFAALAAFAWAIAVMWPSLRERFGGGGE